MTTMLEVLEETIAAYTLGTRAVDANSSCEYLTVDGRMCAVGRCMINPIVAPNGSVNVVNADTPGGLDSLLKPEYRGLGITFWRLVQRLHDYRLNWTNEGLSDEGKVNAQTIVSYFNLWGETRDNNA